MNIWKRTTFYAVVFTFLLALFGTLSGQADSFFYRFTTPLLTVTCTAPTPDQLSVDLFEFNNEYDLPAGATLAITYLRNGDSSPQIAFSLPTGVGSNDANRWLGFGDTITATSLVGALQYDTMIGGSVVYRSTLHFNCNGAGTGTAFITNEEISGGGSGTEEPPSGTEEPPSPAPQPVHVGGINDGRINPQNFAPVALYCDGTVLKAYAISGTGGTFTWSYDFSTSPVAAFPNLSGIVLSKTPDNRYSVLAPQSDGKQYLFIFDGCPSPGATQVFVSDPATGQWISTQ